MNIYISLAFFLSLRAPFLPPPPSLCSPLLRRCDAVPSQRSDRTELQGKWKIRAQIKFYFVRSITIFSCMPSALLFLFIFVCALGCPCLRNFRRNVKIKISFRAVCAHRDTLPTPAGARPPSAPATNVFANIFNFNIEQLFSECLFHGSIKNSCTEFNFALCERNNLPTFSISTAEDGECFFHSAFGPLALFS